jgi:hypothetical protein
MPHAPACGRMPAAGCGHRPAESMRIWQLHGGEEKPSLQSSPPSTTASQAGASSAIRLLHAAGSFRGGQRSSRRHQPQPLQKENGSLGWATPHQLATFSLAVLDVDIAPRILQAAVLKDAVDKHTLIENDMLIFKRSVFVSSHTRKPNPSLRIPGTPSLSALPRLHHSPRASRISLEL